MRRLQRFSPASRRARRQVDAVYFWWHSIEVAPGVVTPGIKTPTIHATELAAMSFPDLSGKTVLDIGGWDGFYAFHAEELGASRVALIDHYVWSLDFKGLHEQQAETSGATSKLYHETEFWRPDSLPGKEGFDTARALRGSKVEPIVSDFMTTPPEEIGTWDVVLFLGVLYHLQDPLGGLRWLAAVTGEQAIIESEAIAVVGKPESSLWEFYPSDELVGDSSNWFAPTAVALTGGLRAAGFNRVEMLVEPPLAGREAGEIVHYRAIAHAFK